ncbi:MAG TPA: site-specific integrase [Chthoniobacterales bacterium]|nr:site-specific integrase [Chthoniobacterales bacterium]
MPRSSSLKPSEVKSRKARGLAAWCVNVPPELSETGKRRQLFFETKSEALGEYERLKARRDNFGNSLSAITPARIAEASEAYKLLDQRHARDSLLAIVRQYLAQHDLRSQSVRLGTLFDEYVAAKSHRTEKYLAEINKSRAPLEGLLDRLICDIAPAELEHRLSRSSGAYRNAVMRYVRAMFNYGIKRGYLLDNPILKLDFAHRVRREVQTIPAPIVAKMLNHAIENDLQLVPFLVLGFFAGIRPDGELQKVEWSDILFDENTIVIRPEVSKTNRRRFPRLSANAQSWLDEYKRGGGATEGKIVPFTSNILRTKRRANWLAAVGENAKWIQQGMRHTFCSNWLAHHKDINELVLQSGHDSVDTMWRNYHKGVTEKEAKEFWAIRPAKGAENVVSFATAAQA